ncbi:MAG TPA: hypothetical protein VGQ37_08315 [Vicinamibacterales bacterium]|jgi:hypothetical protein|nr:hypothetical protein [Vicinamibacterales bacterium]
MTTRKPDDVNVVPMPLQESDEERRRIRHSNDRDQRAEQQGEQAPHNRGYDKAADGADALPINPIDED